MVELALSYSSIMEEFSLETICKSIANLMMPLSWLIDQKATGEEIKIIEKCSIKLNLAKYKSLEDENYLFKKYSKEKYGGVSKQPIPKLQKWKRICDCWIIYYFNLWDK